MDKQQEKLLQTVATSVIVGYGVYLVVGKPLLSLFGADPADKATIQSVDSTPPDQNPFSYQYQPMLDQLDSQGIDLSTFVTEAQQDIQGATDDQKQQALANSDGGGLGEIDVAVLAEQIWNAFGFWHFIGDVGAITDAFNQMDTQAEVSAVAAYFQLIYGKDLWDFLKNGTGMMYRGVKPADLAAIVNRVKALPQN